jgi:hypothetical protein
MTKILARGQQVLYLPKRANILIHSNDIRAGFVMIDDGQEIGHSLVYFWDGDRPGVLDKFDNPKMVFSAFLECISTAPQSVVSTAIQDILKGDL